MLFGKRCRGVFLGDHGPEFVQGDIGEIAAGDLPLVVGFDDHRGGQSQERCRVGEDLHDIGPALDLLVQPLDYPALGVGVNPVWVSASTVEALEMVGEGMGDAVMAGCFVGPAAVLRVGFEGLDVGELASEGTAEFGRGDVVVAVFTDVGIRAGAGGWVARSNRARPGFSASHCAAS